jgi:hypothetical protein
LKWLTKDGFLWRSVLLAFILPLMVAGSRVLRSHHIIEVYERKKQRREKVWVLRQEHSRLCCSR